MTPKELLKLIYETKGYYTDMVDSLVDFEGVHLVLSKKELEKLASRLIEVDSIDRLNQLLEESQHDRMNLHRIEVAE